MFVHGDNLTQKENHRTKYMDVESTQYLAEIREEYDRWHCANMDLIGPSLDSSNSEDTIEKRVELFSNYKNFIDEQKYAEKFDSRSNLHSTVLEEFMFYLFRDLISDMSDSALIGKVHTVKDFFFLPGNFRDMLREPHLRTEKKDHDFVIGVNINSSFICEGQHLREEEVFQVPAVAIECKTYLDKTMLEGASTAAEQLKMRNPNAIYIIVSEWLKLTEAVNLNKFSVDQIYVLRRQKNTDREFRFLPGYEKNPIYADIVIHLYNTVKDHLTSDWEGGIQQRLERGWLK